MSEELQFRLGKQAEATVAGPHVPMQIDKASAELARAGQTSLPELSEGKDTLRAIEETLIEDYAFPGQGPALLAGYLPRIQVVGITGRVGKSERAGEAAAGIRRLSRRRGWAIIDAAVPKVTHFNNGSKGITPGLGTLLGDERAERNCGRVQRSITRLKNRAGPLPTFPMNFWGERFYPALEGKGFHP